MIEITETGIVIEIRPKEITVEIGTGGGGGAAVWGSITGTLANQTDLAAALQAKADSAALGAMAYEDDAPADNVEYVRKNRGWAVKSGGGGGGSAAWGDIIGTLSNQTDLQSALDDKAAADHNHDGTYAGISHTHDDRYLTEAETVQAIDYKISLVTDELGALAVKDSVDYRTDVTNKPTLGTMAAVNDAPADGNEYVRKNGNWAVSSGGGGGGAAWGSITGTLSSQSDLQSALDGKAAANHNHDGSYSALGHTHDDRYYTEAETDALLAAKANSADLGAMASEDDAPHNGAEYVRKNSGWALSNMGLMAEWGHVSGTLADQTDLSTALAAKANSADLGSIAGANYTISDTDLTAGDPLPTGDLYFYYESGS